MAAIIRAPSVAAIGRQLRRPGVAPVSAAVAASAALPATTTAPAATATPVTPVAPAAPVLPVVPVAAALAAAPTPVVPLVPVVPAPPEPEPSALQQEAQRLRQQAGELEARAHALTAAESALTQQQQALAQQQEQLDSARRQLQDEADAIRAAAEQRGHAHGLQQGEDEAREAAAAHTARVNTVVQAVQHTRAALLEEQEDMLVEISFAAVCRILGAQAATRAGLASQVRSLIDGQRELEQLRIRLHPQDLSLLAADRAGLDARLQLEADDSIALGGCLVDSPRGTLDARLELQLQQLRAALTLTRQQQRQPEEPV